MLNNKNNILSSDITYPLTRLILIALATLITTTFSNQLFSAEYNDEDVEPYIKKIYFTKDAVGFVSVPIFYLDPDLKEKMYFVLYRNEKQGREIDQSEFRRLFKTELENNKSNHNRDNTLSTSDGTKYISTSDNMTCPWVSDVSEYAKRHIVGVQSLKLMGKTVKTQVHICNKITALEHVNDNLWIGTGYSGDHGNHKGQGVIIQDRRTGNVIKELKNITFWTSRILHDPYSDKVWIAASRNLYQMSPEGNLISQYRFFHKFDSLSGLPTIILSKEKEITNPIAVLARTMTKEHAKEIYQASLSIPKSDMHSVSLYSFYMCCNISPDYYYPNSMNNLAPTILKELKVLTKLTGRKPDFLIERWIQTVCNFNNPQVLTFFKSERIEENKFPVGLVKSCIKKLE